MARRGVVTNVEFNDRDKRPIRWRRYPCLFLIVCEDGKTEPYYFEMFKKHIPNETIFLKAVGTGRSSIGVVQQAIVEKERLSEESNKSVDEVWAVFDKDDAEKNPANTNRFQEAFKLAQEHKIKVAYSNEVFELWLLLHFIEVISSTPIPRADIYGQLEQIIRKYPPYDLFVYLHGAKEVIDIIHNIGDESHAIVIAEKLSTEHKVIGKQPIDANPSTTVHVLVKQLRSLIEYYTTTPV